MHNEQVKICNIREISGLFMVIVSVPLGCRYFTAVHPDVYVIVITNLAETSLPARYIKIPQ